MASLGRFAIFLALLFVLLNIVNVSHAQRNPFPTLTATTTQGQSSQTQTQPTGTTQNTQTGKGPETSNTQSTSSGASQQDSSTDSNNPTDTSGPGSSGGNQPTQPPAQTYVSTNPGGGYVTITSTSTSYSIYPNVPTSAQSNNPGQSANESSGGSDSSTNVFTAAIVVGAVVIAAAIGIWIFRKWKLTPSRNFKEKIQPVNFAPRSMESDTVFLRELNEP